MQTYRVTVREVTCTDYSVEAENEDAARQAIEEAEDREQFAPELSCEGSEWAVLEVVEAST